jgi:ATP-dependent Clp protease protease subunit
MNKKKTKRAKHLEEDENTEEVVDGPEGDPVDPFGALFSSMEKPDLRTIGLFGEVNEERAAELIIGLIMMCEEGDVEEKRDIKFYLSTYGGNADDMFALYDMVNYVKAKGYDVETIGLGKVMSAGVLLLSSGTPGKRKIGKHCRVMIHACNAGNMGNIYNLQNEMEAINDLQEKYSNAIVENTSMTKRQLKKLLDRKLNIYLTADEAIEYGIADEII